MFESIMMMQAYLMLSAAIIHGESLREAGPDYFEANCYIEGYEAQGCANARRQGLLAGIFPVDLSQEETND